MSCSPLGEWLGEILEAFVLLEDFVSCFFGFNSLAFSYFYFIVLGASFTFY